MLGKLLKYEFKDTARVIPFFYLITLFFSAITLIARQIGLEWFKITSSILLILVGSTVVIITFVVIVMRFYKNLYSNEGYLMFTLPVKPQLLLVSKTIAAFTWMVISLIFLIGTILVSLYCLGVSSSDLSEMMSELKKYGFEKTIFLIIPLVFLSIMFLLSQIFFAITVANRPAFQNMGVGAAFLVYLATYVVLKIVDSVIAIFAPFSIELNIVGNVSASLSTKNMFGYLIDSIKGIEPSSIQIGLGGFVFEVIMACVLFYITGRMMNKKVSLR